MNTKVTVLLLCILPLSLFAQNGYEIHAKFKNALPDSMVYLCHYYAKGLPKVYLSDSARCTKKGEVTFKSKEKIIGGIYLLLWSDKSKTIELILQNNAKINFTADKNDVTSTIRFEDNSENTKFYTYQKYIDDYGKHFSQLNTELQAAHTLKDTQIIQEKIQTLSKELNEYRSQFVANNPTLFVSTLFNALSEPELPQGKAAFPKDAQGQVDSNFRFTFFKSNYWKKFDLSDDRLIYTPLFDSKLDFYFNKLVMPIPDSVNYEAKKILQQTRSSSELFKYTLNWLTYWTETSKIMGMDESFVYLVENYYMKGNAPWLADTTLEKIIDKARKIIPNMIGNKAPDLQLQEKGTNKTIQFSSYYPQNDYTILIFWSPDCGHCKSQVPMVDSVVRELNKKYKIGIFGCVTEAYDKWDDFIKNKNLSSYWYHTSDPQHTSGYYPLYYVGTTPTIYLIDKQGIIRGKRIDETHFEGLIEFREKMKAKELLNKNK